MVNNRFRVALSSGFKKPDGSMTYPSFDLSFFQNDKEIDLILSPAMGGIIIGYEMGKILNKETIFSERVDGEFKLRRDFSIDKNKKVLIIEDVITTGKSSLECSKLATSAVAKVVGYACIIDLSLRHI